MKTIPLADAFRILENASAVIIDNVVTYPTLDDLTGEADNQFLLLSWDDEGSEFNVKFREGDNTSVILVGSSMLLKDSDGNETQVSILEPANIEQGATTHNATPCTITAINALTRITEKVERVVSLRRSGGTITDDDWKELHRLTQDARETIKAANAASAHG